MKPLVGNRKLASPVLEIMGSKSTTSEVQKPTHVNKSEEVMEISAIKDVKPPSADAAKTSSQTPTPALPHMGNSLLSPSGLLGSTKNTPSASKLPTPGPASASFQAQHKYAKVVKPVVTSASSTPVRTPVKINDSLHKSSPAVVEIPDSPDLQKSVIEIPDSPEKKISANMPSKPLLISNGSTTSKPGHGTPTGSQNSLSLPSSRPQAGLNLSRQSSNPGLSSHSQQLKTPHSPGANGVGLFISYFLVQS